MIAKLFTFLFDLVIKLVQVLLSGVDAVINQFLPSVGDAINMVSSLFNSVLSYIPWVMSWIGLNTTVVTIVVAVITFQLTVPILIHTIKLAIKWYDKLKP